jgi:hypothetical protein
LKTGNKNWSCQSALRPYALPLEAAVGKADVAIQARRQLAFLGEGIGCLFVPF